QQPDSWYNGGDFPSVPLTKVAFDTTPHHALAYVFFGHVNIDYDGSPTAYGPVGINPPPDDDLGNAGNAAQGWFGVMSYAPDHPLVTSGKVRIDQDAPQFLGKFPVIQRKENGDPKPGYYVSTGPQSHGHEYLQNSYIDASQVPFGALDKRLIPLGFNLGDFGLAIRHDQNLQSGFYFVDMGASKYALGECSHRVGKDLGGTGRGSHFNNNFPVSFIIFPRSSVQVPGMILELSDNVIMEAIRQRLVELSRASNAKELVLLMGFNAVSPPNKPRGKEQLDDYLHNPGRPKPPNYVTILLGLATFGFQPYLPTPKRAEIF
ncbi:MAG TPA: hypothetical protein VK619_04595, partial [Pyrinomonadaceae bacterium]|nr:hypothetical protein [Pyrinomonadaceae bacterium]